MWTRARSRRLGWSGLCVGIGALSVDVGAQPAEPGPVTTAAPAAAPASTASTPAPAVDAAPTADVAPVPAAPATAAAAPVVRPAVDCRRTDGCRHAGLCTAYDNRCVASTDAECAWSIGCRTHGMCRAANGQCTYDRCRSSDECRDKGRCTSSEDGCVAGVPDDCRRSRACIEDGQCYLSRDKHRCTDGMRRRSTGALIGGAISLGVGGVALLGGSALMITAETYECDGFICVYDQQELDTFRYTGIVMLIVGGAAASVGIPLLIYGAPKETDESAVQTMSAWQPEIRVGPTGGSVRWEF